MAGYETTLDPINLIGSNDSASFNSSDLDEIVSRVVPAFFGLIGITGLIGNALVILVVVSNPQMRSNTNIMILNLAIADLCFVIFCVPFTAADYVTPLWPFGELWCKIVQYLIVVMVHASIYTLVLMSFDRFLAVVYPIACRSLRTERNTRKAITILWFVVVVLASPVPFLHDVVTSKHDNQVVKSCMLNGTPQQKTIYHIIFFSTSYLIPLALISGLYLRMCIRLWQTVVGGNMSAESQRGRKRVTRLVVVVVFAFASLWFPIQMILLLKSINLFHIHTTFDALLQVTSHVIAYTSSCINPVLYAFLSENFRKAFKKIVYCRPNRAYNNINNGGQHQPLASQSRTTRTGSFCPEDHTRVDCV